MLLSVNWLQVDHAEKPGASEAKEVNAQEREVHADTRAAMAH